MRHCTHVFASTILHASNVSQSSYTQHLAHFMFWNGRVQLDKWEWNTNNNKCQKIANDHKKSERPHLLTSAPNTTHASQSSSLALSAQYTANNTNIITFFVFFQYVKTLFWFLTWIKTSEKLTQFWPFNKFCVCVRLFSVNFWS